MSDDDREECVEYADDLPVYLAGTLDPARSAEIEKHLGSCPGCRDEADDLAGIREVLVRDHVSSKRLIEYATKNDFGDVEAHLANCAECREDLELVRRAATDEPGGEPPRGTRPRRRNWWQGAFWTAAAAAAVLAAVAFYTSGEPQRREPLVSSVSPHILNAALRGPQGRETVLEGEGPWLLVVRLPTRAPTGDYRLSIQGPGGPVFSNVLPSEGEGFVTFSVSALDEGTYQLTLVPEEDGSLDPYRCAFRVEAGG